MHTHDTSGDDPTDPTHYTRDPHKLTAYLVAFPKPHLKDQQAVEHIPGRFLIYTPPPPPIPAPREGEQEGKVTKLQRKWQDEVRAAKTSDAKVTSWKGVKSRATKGIDWAMGQTKSSSLEFLNRVPGQSSGHENDTHADDGHDEGDETHRTVGLEEMVLVYPTSIQGTQEQIREEFINSMLRTKSKAQKDAIIATGLIPVTLAIDILATVIWPFGGLAEIDTVWAAANVRGAKTARSVTKRLNSSIPTGGASGGTFSGMASKAGSAAGKFTNMLSNKMSGNTHGSTAQGGAPTTGAAPAGATQGEVVPAQEQAVQGGAPHSQTAATGNEPSLRLTFIPSPRTNVLEKYLAGHCHRYDAKMFQSPGVLPTETDIVNAIGWSPSSTGGETKNWEDEQWELAEVKEDVQSVMHKGAKEWDKWVKAYEKDPQKALQK